MWEYRTETFSSTFDTKKTLKEKTQKILSSAGKEGWELVNFQCAGAGTMMILVFKKSAESP